jgi:hypothetical protein
MKNYMNWFTGVVEDRVDPQELGRVRVRIFGLHTDDIGKITVGDLPWAHVMMPVTSASISGVGFSPTGLVEGSWVVGFFADGEDCQDPIILGSIHGYPSQNANERSAFKDFEGRYPRWYNETDVSKVARGSWKEHQSYFARYGEKVTGIEKATAPNLETVSSTASAETRETWDEPEPRRGVAGSYPFVHTFESESGIVREIDDTNGNPRIVEYHPGGTFYEIFPDGDKLTKISGDNYEIVIHDESILIRGNQTITIEGSARHLVKGDYTMEVTGDYNLKVHGNRNTKVTMNDNFEIVGNFNLNVKEDFLTRVGNNQQLMIGVDKTESIGGKSSLSVTGATDFIHMDTLSIFSNGAQSITTNNTQLLQSKSGLTFNSQANWTLKCNAALSMDVSGTIGIKSGSSMTTESTSTLMKSGSAFTVNAAAIALD